MALQPNSRFKVFKYDPRQGYVEEVIHLGWRGSESPEKQEPTAVKAFRNYL